MEQHLKDNEGNIVHCTFLALAYGYTLSVKETPEQIDDLIGGLVDGGWTYLDNSGICPVTPSRKVLVVYNRVRRAFDGEWDYEIFEEESVEAVEAGSLDWRIESLNSLGDKLQDASKRPNRKHWTGIVKYKVVGY